MNAIIVFLSVAAACVAAAPASEEPIAIVSQDSEVNPDGSFVNNWETANGISVHEQGAVKALEKDEVAQVITGTAKWTDKDGTPIELTWVADENGFQPQGAHLPTPPPAPELPAWYLKAKEWSDAHPYDEAKELAKTYN